MDREENGFARFPDLPFELRLQIWEEVMPAHGICLVDCHVALVDGGDDQDGHKALRLALRPAPHKFQACGFAQRVRAQTAMLATCTESRTVLCKQFPDTVGGSGQRLSFQHDLIYIVPDFLYWTLGAPKLPQELRLEFEGGWNDAARRLALNCDFWQNLHRLVRVPARMPWQYRNGTVFKRLMEFLTTFTSLSQLYLAIPDGIGHGAWERLRRGEWAPLAESVTDCCGGLTCQASEQSRVRIAYLDETVLFLRQAIVDDIEPAIHHDWLGKVKTGYPALRDLEISRMVHVSTELRLGCRDF